MKKLFCKYFGHNWKLPDIASRRDRSILVKGKVKLTEAICARCGLQVSGHFQARK